MSQVTGPLSILDGQATPVAHSFAPERVAPDGSVFTERTAASSAGYLRLGIKYSAASSQRATNRVDVSFTYPVLQTVNGVSSVAYTGRFAGYFVIPDTMTQAERWNLAAYVANALDATAIRAVVKDLDPLY